MKRIERGVWGVGGVGWGELEEMKVDELVD